MEIKMKNYTKKIKGRMILDKISLNLEGGKVYKLEGPNGSGKTMLLRAIAGLIYPTEGTLLINEEEIKSNRAYPVKVGALIENPEFWKDYTGIEVLKYLAAIRNEISNSDIEDVMREMLLDPDDKRQIEEYSLGMKRKLGIIQAVMENPDIILLDEPLNALDSEAIDAFSKVINKHKTRGALIIIAIHNKTVSESETINFDETIRIEEGCVVNE